MSSGRRSARALPKGVYEFGGKYKVQTWDKDEETGAYVHNYHGLFSTKEEAEYVQLLASQGHHWVGEEHDPENYWGFIYLITDRLSGKMYIGKKQYRLWDGPQGGYKCTDPTDSEWFDKSIWRENDWKTYTGSCEPLNREIAAGNVWNYEYRVLYLCRNKLTLHIAEMLEQIERDVLEKLDTDGNYLYYNRNIGGVEFRAPFLKSDMVEKRETSEREMKAYYLRPRLCRNCESVIPYPGTGECVECHS